MLVLSERFSRRSLLKIGSLGVANVTLADLLRLKANAAVSPKRAFKSVIMVFLPGGPSHIDMYDLKPDAPAEYRGEFDPIRTNVPGIDICEHMPLQAKIADKLSIVRGLKTFGFHDPYELLTTGKAVVTGQNPPNPRPAFGSLVSKIQGDRADGLPPYIGIKDLRLAPSYDDPETPGYLGASHQPFRASGPALDNLSLASGMTLDRLGERKTLLRSFDNLRRDVDDRHQSVSSMDRFTSRALEIISSNKVRDAFDVAQEPESVRNLYGEAEDFLLARRLVEAGVSVVTLPCRPLVRTAGGLAINQWDTHAHNFKFLSLMLPIYDQAISALITDLHRLGLDQDVAVVVWGEFGRTPRIDNELVANSGGRGHWPEAGFVMISGGGLKMGQVVGETDRLAERAVGRPFTSSNILATLYHVLGIDPSQTVLDHAGRPQYLLDNRAPIRELI